VIIIQAKHKYIVGLRHKSCKHHVDNMGVARHKVKGKITTPSGGSRTPRVYDAVRGCY